MANAARAYSRSAAPKRTSPIRVVPGKRTEEMPSSIFFGIRIFMIILAVFAVVAFVRIGFASATVTTSIQTDKINSQVEEIRSGSAHLEVTESSLSNPTTVKSTAVKKLGMYAPYEVNTIHLSDDVVAYDEAGNLSLARSMARSNAS